MKKQVNLFEILGERGEYGLIQYLKQATETEVKSIRRQYVFKKGVTDRDEIIREALKTMEKSLNIGYVFRENQTQYRLVALYK